METNENTNKISAYKLDNKNGNIQMNINEYNYKHSNELINTLNRAVTYENIMQYSSLNSKYQYELINKLEEFINVDKNQILLLNGGDVSINNILKTYSTDRSTVLIYGPTYTQYDRISKSFTNNIVHIQLSDKESDLLLDQYMLRPNNGIICFLCNPNNPTGYEWEEIELKRMFKKYPNILFIIDETYIDFSILSNEKSIYTCTECINDYKNIIIMRSFSKAFGLAGLRISYLVSNEKNISNISTITSHKDIIEIAKISAFTILNNLQFYKCQINRMFEDKQRIIDTCIECNIEYINTKCNFILIFIGNHELEITNEFLKNNISIKSLSKSYDNHLKHYIRISLHPDYISIVSLILHKFQNKINSYFV